jgi:hypothetical protein
LRGQVDRAGLVLQRLEQPHRPKKLGERAAAIAQQGVERAGAVAVADQRQRQVAAAVPQPVGKKLHLDPLGALEPPGGAHDPAGQQELEAAFGCQLLEQRRLERGERLGVLVGNQVLVGAQPVLEGILRHARLALVGTGTARLRTVAPAGRGARRRQADAHGNSSNPGRGRATTRQRQHT